MELHEGLESLGERAFYDCKLLKDKKLPKSLKNKGKCIFGEDENDASKTNENLAKVSLSGVGEKNNPSVSAKKDKFDSRVSKNVSQNKDSGKISSSVGIETKSKKESDFTSFVKAAEFLREAKSDVNIKINANEKYEEVKACEILSKALKDIQRGNKSIGVSLDLSESNFNIEEKAFYNCRSLKAIKLPENISEIGNRAFGKCFALEHVKLPKDLQVISSSLFFDCGSLKDIEIPMCVRTIEKYAFEFCHRLERVTFSEELREFKEIDCYAFAWCSSLKSIKIPTGIKFIGKYAFESCKKVFFEEPCEWYLKKGNLWCFGKI